MDYAWQDRRDMPRTSGILSAKRDTDQTLYRPDRMTRLECAIDQSRQSQPSWANEFFGRTIFLRFRTSITCRASKFASKGQSAPTDRIMRISHSLPSSTGALDESR